MKIKILSDSTINKISAGEVIERPSSVVKELVENSIDAGADKIDILLEQAGKNLIIIRDNGAGMDCAELELAIQRHATSKLDEDDLLNICSFGFRGEALPSIGAISKFKITSRKKKSENAYSVSIIGGIKEQLVKAALDIGTITEVRDLFFATPARLKFLRTDKTELNAIVSLVKKIALSHPHISFTLTHNGRELLKVRKEQNAVTESIHKRIGEIMGDEFIKNSVYVDYKQSDIEIYGYTTIPTYNRASAEEQFLFINHRPVKDKILNIALKVAYQDFLPRDRHAICVLFLNMDPHLVDVNVHPAKTQVRFHEPNMIRSIVINAIKDSLKADSQRVSTTLSDKAIGYMKPEIIAPDLSNNKLSNSANQKQEASNFDYKQNNEEVFNDNYSNASAKFIVPQNQQKFAYHDDKPNIKATIVNSEIETNNDYLLGAAVCQLHNTYIISQIKDGFIITDQHAAHERLGYEKIKKQLEKNGITKQRLLIPEIVEFSDAAKAEIIFDNKKSLSNLGLSVEKFGENSIIVSEMPSLLGDVNIDQLINDLADHLIEMEENIALTEIIEHVTETYACYYAIRAGRSLNISEMNELLRQMEETEFSAQCNHGRPTYVKMNLKDIEKLFGRR